MHTQSMGHVVAAAVLALAAAARAATYYVAPGGSDGNDGTSGWGQAYATLSNAVAKAQDDDTVLVSNGNYTVTAHVRVDRRVRIRSYNNGTADPDGTLVDGGNAVRGFYLNHAGAVLDGVTVSNGNRYNAESGGGIYLNAGLVTNCVVVNCIASNGGGLYVNTNTLVKNCTIAENTSSTNCTTHSGGGGGIFMNGGLVTNCLVSRNVALQAGGGVLVQLGGTLANSTIVSNRTRIGTISAGGSGVRMYNSRYNLVANCVITGNQYNVDVVGDTGGGAVALNQGNSTGNGGTVSNCLIVNNTSVYGGGVYGQQGGPASVSQFIACRIYNNSASLSGGGAHFYSDGAGRFLDCELVGNTAKYGGGLYAKSKNVSLTNCLIVKNRAVTSYGGLYFGQQGDAIESCTIASNNSFGIYFPAGTQRELRNSIVMSNAVNLSLVAGSTVSVYYCCTTVTGGALVAEGCISNPPGFVNSGGNDFRLASDSPCVNAGTNQAWMDGARDLDGRARVDPFSGRVDMGAYEYLPPGALFKLK